MRSDSARSTDTEPLAALTLAAPVTTPTRTFPLLVETSAVPSTAPIRMSLEPPCTSAEPLTPATVISPRPLRTFSGPVSASRTAPRSVLSVTVPSAPSAWKSPIPASPRTSESVGNWMTTSIDSGRLLLKLTKRLRGFLETMLSVRVASSYSTRVFSAALMSAALAGLLGRTSTLVSVRSETAKRTSAT